MVEFFLALGLMLGTAWLLGEAFHRVGQPALVGQLLAGVLIGPSILNIVQPTADLGVVENVALFFIMVLTGLAVKPARVAAAGARGVVVSSVAFVIPFLGGVGVAQASGIGTVSALTIGLTISITAVPTNAIILMELGILDTELGTTVIAAGVVDDIISFVALGLIRQFAGDSGIGSAGTILAVVKVVVFLGALLLCERLLRTNATRVRGWTERIARRMRAPGSYTALLLIFAIGVSLLAEWAGLQLVIGAFFAGLLLSDIAGPETLEEAEDVIRGATFGFFCPLAFAFIGTEFVLSSVGDIPLLVAALLTVAVASKLVGGYVGARIARFSSAESVAIGFLMNSRGFLELVIAATAYQLGLVDQSLFSMVVGIGIITTIISPITSRLAMRRTKLQMAA